MFLRKVFIVTFVAAFSYISLAVQRRTQAARKRSDNARDALSPLSSSCPSICLYYSLCASSLLLLDSSEFISPMRSLSTFFSTRGDLVLPIPSFPANIRVFFALMRRATRSHSFNTSVGFVSPLSATHTDFIFVRRPNSVWPGDGQMERT